MAKDLTEALAALTEAAAGQTSRENKSLTATPARSSIPERTGSSKPTATQSTGGAGYVSPLVEIAYNQREWHPMTTLWTSDGIFSFRFAHPKKMKMRDSATPTPTPFDFMPAAPT